MKKTLIYSTTIFLLGVILLLSSCNKVPLDVKYNLSDLSVCIKAKAAYKYDTIAFTIKHSDVQKAITDAGGDVSKVTSAQVGGLIAQVNTASADFTQISSIEVYLKSASDSTSNVGDQVAYSVGTGSGVTQTTLKLNGTNETKILTEDVILTVKVLNVSGGNNAICFKLVSGFVEVKVKQ